MQQAKSANPNACSINASSHMGKEDKPTSHEGMSVPALPAGMKESPTPKYPPQDTNGAPKGDNGGSVDTSPYETIKVL